MPLISVIVPIYNVGDYLKQCLDSILAQSFTDFELILVDDGSTDNCPNICDEYARADKRIIVIHKENRGLSSARNAGLDYAFSNSNSQYISFVDSDDYIHPDFLNDLLQAIDGCDMSLCYYSQFVDSNEPKVPNVKVVKKDDYWTLVNSNNSFTICAWNKLYKKDIFQNIRYPIGRIFEDSFIIHDIVLQCNKISVVEKFLYFYRIRPDSIVHSFDDIKGTIDSLECKLNRVRIYYNAEDKKMFPVVFDDCFDFLVHSYMKANTGKNKPFHECIICDFKELKMIYMSKKFKLLHKKRIVYRLFFASPKLYYLLRSIKTRIKK